MRDTPARDAGLLWPHIEPRVRSLVRAAAGAGISGVAEHELGGSQHKGVLRNDQAPQFLLADGTRPLTGNLAVGANVTVDGVDISAHAADPNAHHPRNHGITSSDHTATGSKWQVVGLTGANALGLLTPLADVTGSTKEALLKSDAAGKLTLQSAEIANVLYVDGTLDLGVDTIYEDATYLRIEGSKPVRFAPAIQGPNWGITALGAITGTYAAIAGNVDVTGGGDLYVAGSGAYAGSPVLFADSSGGNVGIMRTPDPQFALDVLGPARATYFVGPHAIQLKDALLIAHYDGPEHGPYGEPNGHMGQVGVIAGDVVFRYGKFGKAVEIADSYTNLVSNPSFETDTTGWVDYATGTAAGTRARTNEDAWAGDYSYRIAKTGGAAGDNFGVRLPMAVTSGATYNVSVWVKIAQLSGATANNACLYSYGGTGVNVYSYTSIVGEWVRLSHTVVPNGASLQVRLVILNCTAGTVYFDAIQVTQSAALLPFWGGAGARVAGSLSYASLPVNWSKLTVMAWFRAAAQATALGRNAYLFEVRKDDANRVLLRMNTGTNRLVGDWAGGGATGTAAGTTAITAGVWHHAALVIDGGTARIYLDGVEEGTATLAGVATGLATAWVGSYSLGDRLNGMVDDFAIVNHASSATEVRAVYESNAPVFAESSVWSFRATPRGLVWADDEGLWMRDVAGNPVLGVYGGEAATKSWAGWSDMAVGDVIIGRNVVGAAALRWTQATGKFGFFGGGNATPQVEIGTDGRIKAINADLSGAITATSGSIAGILSIGASGEIRQGTGTLGTDFTGLRVWQSGNVGLIGGYNNNLLQWYADTDGSLHAGAGVLAIGLAGIQIAVPASWTNVNGYQFVLSPYTLSAGLFAQYISGSDRMYTRQQTLSPDFTTVTVSSLAQNTKGVGGFASNDMAATAGTTTAIIELFADRAGGVGSARIAANVLKLENLTTNTGAVGTYAGKVKINIGGTDVWIPYYSS